MPLTRDPTSPVVPDFHADGLRFRMVDGDTSISIFVSKEALRDRSGEDGKDQRNLTARFHDYRSEIESIASRKYERGEAPVTVKSADLAR
ncbi:DUF1488 family protein [Hyphomicrobium sp. CS1BSMeth3]|uniref:DUF1488 family protein n=1 Tax=Hyphomicrobium sp. CS1BSMeth3 TaxID=1892844 RepID=UPI00092FF4A1|nr:DUF1488 family protein [Hyphomicrobium sp. CS1BSMeth3]